MTAILLDTHTWAWSLAGDARLSQRALVAINEADIVLVSPISFFEIAQKVRLGKWPEMVPFLDQLPSLLEAQGGVVANFGVAICLMAGMMDWSHRDPVRPAACRDSPARRHASRLRRCDVRRRHH